MVAKPQFIAVLGARALGKEQCEGGEEQAECGGRARIIDGYVTGSPELIGEVTASTASYDLHDKLHAYRRNGVQEYVVWRAWDLAVDWFVLREGQYDRRDPDQDGIFRSQAFPGL